MLTVTPLSQDTLLTYPALHTYCSSSPSPPVPKKKRTRRAGRRIRAAHELNRNSLPPASPPTHPVSTLIVDTPTSLPAPSRPPPASSLYSESPLTRSIIEPVLQNLVNKILDIVREKVEWIVSNVEELDDRVHERLAGEIRRLEKVILTGDSHLLHFPWHDPLFDHSLTGDSQYSKPP